MGDTSGAGLMIFGLAMWTCLWVVVGGILGKKKGRVGFAVLMSALFGPIGWALVYFGPDLRSPAQKAEDKKEKSFPIHVALENPQSSITSEIEKLSELHAKGVLSDEEFKQAKKKLL